MYILFNYALNCYLQVATCSGSVDNLSSAIRLYRFSPPKPQNANRFPADKTRAKFCRRPQRQAGTEYYYVLLNNLNPLIIEFNLIQSEIEFLSDSPDSEQVERDNFEVDYYDLCSTIEVTLETFTVSQQNEQSINLNQTVCSSNLMANSTHLQLPVINLETFSGDYEKWIEFRDCFQAIVGKNTALSNVQKLCYLRKSLSCDVLKTIESLTLTDANYEVAWRSLTNRYEKGQPIESWDAILVPIITDKLDAKSQREWELFHIQEIEKNPNNHVSSTVKDLLKTIKNQRNIGPIEPNQRSLNIEQRTHFGHLRKSYEENLSTSNENQENKNKLKELKIKRGFLKGNLTRCKTHLNKLNLETIDKKCYLELQRRLNNLNPLIIEFNLIQSEIEFLSDSPDSEQVERDNFEVDYYDLCSTIEVTLETFTVSQQNEQSINLNQTVCSSNLMANSTHLQLPVINLETFSGDYEKWIEFRDCFQAIVGKNTALSNVQKLCYLRKSLSCDVLKTIESLTLTDANYEVAWRSLTNRYEKGKRIVESHVRKIISFPPLLKESAKDLRNLYDTIANNLESLKTLGQPIESWDAILVPIITDKLDAKSQREWELFHIQEIEKNPNNHVSSTVKDLLKTIKRRCDLLESLRVEKSDTINSNSPTNRNECRRKTTLSHLNTNALSCYFCKGEHTIYKCEKFQKLTILERIKEIKKRNYCLVCLRPHGNSPCTASNCRKCNKFHNTLLHINYNSSNIAVACSTNTSVSNDHSELVTDTDNNVTTAVTAITKENTISLVANSQVLLSTALIYVRDLNGKLHECRALLDSGSMANFVTKNFLHILKLNVSRINHAVMGVGQVSSTVEYKSILTISSKDKTFNSSITCLVLEQITGSIPQFSFDTSNLDIPDNFNLADPTFNISRPVNMLLGSGIFWQLLESGQIALKDSRLTLQATKLGWVVAGNNSRIPLTNSISCLNTSLDIQIKKFWEIEDLNSKPIQNNLLHHSQRIEEKHCSSIAETITSADSSKFNQSSSPCTVHNKNNIVSTKHYNNIIPLNPSPSINYDQFKKTDFNDHQSIKPTTATCAQFYTGRLDVDDFSSEEKTSGSEYVPSENDLSSTTDEELLNSLFENCIPDSVSVAEVKILSSKPNKLPKEKKRTILPVTMEADSTTPKKDNVVINMARHLEVKHSCETEVAKLLALPKSSKVRKDGFTEICRIGDFHHNCEVISNKCGELIIVRRPTLNEITSVTFTDYGPCPQCLGFMLKKHLWHHIKFTCSKKTQDDEMTLDNTGRHVIAESNAIVSNLFGSEMSTDYKINILNSLRDDDIGLYCKEDHLIVKFGAMQFEKYGLTQIDLIKQWMRQLSRLVLNLKEKFVQNLHLIDFLKPEQFDIVVCTVKELCGCSSNDVTKRPQFAIRSLALKLGHSLKKCANIERGHALRNSDLKKNDLLLNFIHLMEMEWSIRISSNALFTLYRKKLNVPQLLPITDDLRKLNCYIDCKIEELKLKILEDCNWNHFNRLATLTLSRIILFNKRRAGEASKMTVEQYCSRPSWSEQSTDELKNSLTQYEKKLAERLCIVCYWKKGVQSTDKMCIIILHILNVCSDEDNTFISCRNVDSEISSSLFIHPTPNEGLLIKDTTTIKIKKRSN
ncbi:hypothetical protein FQR65_LT14451 [Abscondita terminalis]|nr:hypothetical protein FQR65_LT14451 [Abscondita terminalis]